MEGHGVPYLLKVLSPDGTAVRRFHLAPGEHVVGSLAGVEVQLDEPGVSRRHASIHVLADGGAVVRDLDSKNGTFVAGRRIREAAVSGFTMVAFGSAQAVLQPADPARTQVLLGSGEIPVGTPEKGRPQWPHHGWAPPSGALGPLCARREEIPAGSPLPSP